MLLTSTFWLLERKCQAWMLSIDDDDVKDFRLEQKSLEKMVANEAEKETFDK